VWQRAYHKGVMRLRSSMAGSWWSVLGRERQQITHPDQVVDRQREPEHPTDPRHPAMAGLAQAADGLEPTEDLFHLLALALTDCVARMVGGALVDDTVLLAREVRRYPVLAQFLHQFLELTRFRGVCLGRKGREENNAQNPYTIPG